MASVPSDYYRGHFRIGQHRAIKGSIFRPIFLTRFCMDWPLSAYYEPLRGLYGVILISLIGGRKSFCLFRKFSPLFTDFFFHPFQTSSQGKFAYKQGFSCFSNTSFQILHIILILVFSHSFTTPLGRFRILACSFGPFDTFGIGID